LEAGQLKILQKKERTLLLSFHPKAAGYAAVCVAGQRALQIPVLLDFVGTALALVGDGVHSQRWRRNPFEDGGRDRSIKPQT
jgi:hypothetical protein